MTHLRTRSPLDSNTEIHVNIAGLHQAELAARIP